MVNMSCGWAVKGRGAVVEWGGVHINIGVRSRGKLTVADAWHGNPWDAAAEAACRQTTICCLSVPVKL